VRLLLLGGTKFLGRHLTELAVKRGHGVTLFNRGQTNPSLFPTVEKLRGDRDGGLDALEGRSWDAVIDTCGYVPRVVGDSARLLAAAAPHYTFVSTISVYADFHETGMTEEAPVGKIDDEATEEVTGETYGPLKALCEDEVRRAFPEGALIIRPGLIVGPHDPSDRFTYWPVRMADGGEVLAPGNPGSPVQFVDVRDLAAWMLDMAERKQTGTYNATGPDYSLSMGALLQACQDSVGSDAELTWVPDGFILAHDIKPWTELPLWIPAEAGMPGIDAVDCSRAFNEGLRFRPPGDTISDTLRWARQRPDDYEWVAGLDRAKERAVLRDWHHENRKECESRK